MQRYSFSSLELVEAFRRDHSVQAQESVFGTSGPHRTKRLELTLLLKHRVGETSSPNQSNIPDDLRPSLSKKAKSAPGCIIPARAFNDEAIPIQGLKEKPYTSPCGKAYVRRGNWKNHTHKCKECEAVLQLNQEVEATDENGLPSTRPSTTETTNKGQVEAVEENRGETCGTVLGDEDCGAAHIHAPDSELRK